jgi:hypothetical protein
MCMRPRAAPHLRHVAPLTFLNQPRSFAPLKRAVMPMTTTTADIEGLFVAQDGFESFLLGTHDNAIPISVLVFHFSWPPGGHRGWGGANPVACVTITAILWQKLAMGMTSPLGGQAVYQRACAPCQHVTRGKG